MHNTVIVLLVSYHLLHVHRIPHVVKEDDHTIMVKILHGVHRTKMSITEDNIFISIFYLKGHEWVMNEVPDGAAIFAFSYWLRNSDMYRV
ncbi:hypothetical protein Tco_0328697 [Tanacetum coccineum]